MDFTGVGCLDYSCADEIVAKLVRDKIKVLLLRGLTDAHREAIEPVLAGAGLAVLCERPDGALEGLAPVSRLRRCSTSWSSGGWPHAIREAPSDSPRRETPPPGTLHPRHSRDPKARADWTAVAPRFTKCHIHQSRRLDRRGSVYPLRQQPNQVEIGKKLALLEGADAALFLASGMGATALAHLAVLRPGDHCWRVNGSMAAYTGSSARSSGSWGSTSRS